MTERLVRPIRPAATVILVRDVPEGQYQIFMLKRTSRAAFAGGMFVFPGGKVEPDDHLHKYDAWRTGPSEDQRAQKLALGSEWRGFWIAGIRESFEEAGLLLAYDESGKLLEYHDIESAARYDAYRHDVHEGRLSLLDICQREHLSLALDHIHYFNRWITPEGRPRRFDTRFFIAEAPLVQEGLHDEKETVDSLWISPGEALERHHADDFGLMRVTEMQLTALAEFDTVSDIRNALHKTREFPVYRPYLPAMLPAG